MQKVLAKRSVELEFAEEKGLEQTPEELTEQLNKHLKANIVSFSVLKLIGHTVRVVGGRKLNLIVEPAKYFAEPFAFGIAGFTLATIVGFLEDGLESDAKWMLIPIPIMSVFYFVFFIRTSNFLVNRSILFLEDIYGETDG